MSSRWFDLGNFAANNEFTDDDEQRLLSEYFGEPPDETRAATLKLFRFVSDFREGMWGTVQSVLSDVDFDFRDYGRRAISSACTRSARIRGSQSGSSGYAAPREPRHRAGPVRRGIRRARAAAAALRGAAGRDRRSGRSARRGAAAARGARGDLRRRRAARFDPVPRILTEPEWSELQAGIVQRLRALEAFAGDVYGEGRVFEAGVVTREEVESSPHYEPAMRGASPRRWVAFAGLDVIRCEDGRFRVIEDQLRMPSGIAYAVAWRETLRDLLAVEPPQQDVSPRSASWRSRCGTRRRAGVDEPRMVILSEGPGAAAFWEHERLARELCAPVVTLGDLEHRDGRVVAWLDGRARAVDVVYIRTGEDRFTGEDGRPTAIGEALLEPAAAGTVAVVNAPGSGVADDKLVCGRVDDLVRLYLDEEPLLPSVTSRASARTTSSTTWS